jgi:MFS family permease
MPPDQTATRTIRFVNIAHALVHFVILIYPTAVIAIAAERGLGYSELIGLATGTFLAFGLLSLPVGWMADRVGRRNLLAAFFLGSGASCIGLAFATTPLAFAALLLVLGCFAAIYHPVGSAMLVSNATRLGRELGRNGVWGNLGAALASGVTALIAAQLGWRAAFAVPGALAIGVGAVFLALVPSERRATEKPPGESAKTLPIANPVAIATLYLVAVVAGGITFNVVTIALPKVIDERLGFALPLSAVGTLATSVFILGALTQLTMGRLVDRIELPKLFVGLSLFQPLGLVLATFALGVPMLVGMILAMASIYGQVVVNDAMIARYVAPHLRSKAFGLRYFLGFGVSGLAVPMIALLHGLGGFSAVLGITAAFGATIFASAIGFFLLTRPAPVVPAPARQS